LQLFTDFVHFQINAGGLMQGHEDIDQCFSVQAALIARHTFDNPTELIQILDGSTRPEDPAERQRAWQKVGKVHSEAFKLDEAADWKHWVRMLGVRVKGLRAPEHGSVLWAFSRWRPKICKY
jgi:hypothetical protein